MASVKALVKQATAKTLLEANDSLNTQVSQKINNGQVSGEAVVQQIQSRMFKRHQNPVIVLYTLDLLDHLMLECGGTVQSVVASRIFMRDFRKLVTRSKDPVKSKCLRLLWEWAVDFKGHPRFKMIPETFDALLKEGHTFPTRSPHRPPLVVAQVEESFNTCHYCRCKFGMTNWRRRCHDCSVTLCRKCSVRRGGRIVCGYECVRPSPVFLPLPEPPDATTYDFEEGQYDFYATPLGEEPTEPCLGMDSGQYVCVRRPQADADDVSMFGGMTDEPMYSSADGPEATPNSGPGRPLPELPVALPPSASTPAQMLLTEGVRQPIEQDLPPLPVVEDYDHISSPCVTNDHNTSTTAVVPDVNQETNEDLQEGTDECTAPFTDFTWGRRQPNDSRLRLPDGSQHNGRFSTIDYSLASSRSENVLSLGPEPTEAPIADGRDETSEAPIEDSVQHSSPVLSRAEDASSRDYVNATVMLASEVDNAPNSETSNLERRVQDSNPASSTPHADSGGRSVSASPPRNLDVHDVGVASSVSPDGSDPASADETTLHDGDIGLGQLLDSSQRRSTESKERHLFVSPKIVGADLCDDQGERNTAEESRRRQSPPALNFEPCVNSTRAASIVEEPQAVPKPLKRRPRVPRKLQRQRGLGQASSLLTSSNANPQCPASSSTVSSPTETEKLPSDMFVRTLPRPSFERADSRAERFRDNGESWFGTAGMIHRRHAPTYSSADGQCYPQLDPRFDGKDSSFDGEAPEEAQPRQYWGKQSRRQSYWTPDTPSDPSSTENLFVGPGGRDRLSEGSHWFTPDFERDPYDGCQILYEVDELCPVGNETRPNVFISFCAKESRNAFAVAQTTLELSGYTVFDASVDLNNPSINEMTDRVRKCDIFLVILSPRYFGSKYCCAEAVAAMRGAKFVQPIYDRDSFPLPKVMEWKDMGCSDSDIRNYVYSANAVPILCMQDQAATRTGFLRQLKKRYQAFLFSRAQDDMARTVQPNCTPNLTTELTSPPVATTRHSTAQQEPIDRRPSEDRATKLVPDALIKAVSAGDLKECARALYFGTSQILTVEWTDPDEGVTWRGPPLHASISLGHIEVSMVLVLTGADLEARDGGGMQPLAWAAMKGHTSLAEGMLHQGAPIEATSRIGRTALGLAVCNNHLETAELLLRWGANVHATDDHGETPSICALASGNVDLADMLLNHSTEKSRPKRASFNSKSAVSAPQFPGTVKEVKPGSLRREGHRTLADMQRVKRASYVDSSKVYLPQSWHRRSSGWRRVHYPPDFVGQDYYSGPLYLETVT